MKKPHDKVELVRGAVGNIDARHPTRPAPDIQAQFPVFPSIAQSLPGESRDIVAWT